MEELVSIYCTVMLTVSTSFVLLKPLVWREIFFYSRWHELQKRKTTESGIYQTKEVNFLEKISSAPFLPWKAASFLSVDAKKRDLRCCKWTSKGLFPHRHGVFSVELYWEWQAVIRKMKQPSEKPKKSLHFKLIATNFCKTVELGRG